MNWLIFLFAAAVIFSLLRYGKEPLVFKKKIIFITLRLVQAILICIAFFEPVFHFHRVISTQKTVPVFIDVSQSMLLFQPESTVIPFLRRLHQINETNTSKTKQYRFFLFGDSLREISDLKELKFKDNTSQFPTSYIKYGNITESIIISDGNWTNSIPADFFADNNIQYLQMAGFKQAPFLRILNSEVTGSPADSSSTLHMTIEGRIVENKPVTIKITEKEKLINQLSINGNTGYFKHTLDIKLPSAPPGKHLYRLNAYHSDSLHVNDYTIRYAAPQHFLYQLQSASPSLDRRFIALSISKHQEFRNNKAKELKNDCIFFFDWTDTADEALKKLKPDGIAVFAGCLPCPKYLTISPLNYHYIKSEYLESEFSNDLFLQKLPPPSKVLRCPEASPQTPLLSISQQEKGKQDTVHILFNSEWKGHHSLFFAATDFWKMDFWPMSVEYSEEQAFTFSEFFITLLKAQLLSRISEQFYIYPAKSTDESDSVHLSVSFPSTIPVSRKSDIRIFIKSCEGAPVLDTTIQIINTGSQKQKITLRPFSSGSYILSSTITSENKNYVFSDSLLIEKHNRELQIPGQNKSLLNEIGQPVSPEDSIRLVQNLTTENSGNNLFIEDSFQLNRSWWLLSLIFVFLGIEWIYRRLTGLD